MYTITKSFEFDYAHRVWNQSLNQQYSVDNMPKCRHIHGHHGVISVTLVAKKLNEGEMVTDFKHLNWFRDFINDKLDHKLILDQRDPFIARYIPSLKISSSSEGFIFIDSPTSGNSEVEIEVETGIVIISCVPTSENFARILCNLVAHRMQDFTNIQKVQVSFSETPQSKATYSVCLQH